VDVDDSAGDTTVTKDGHPSPTIETAPAAAADAPAAEPKVVTSEPAAAGPAANLASAGPPEPEATAATAEPGSRRGVPVWQLAAQIVAFIVIVAIAIVGILEWRRADRLSSQRNDRLNASQAAGTFAEALLTYDSANPTATLNRLKTMATASYQPKIEQARSSALSGPAQQSKTTSTAHVENTYITEVDGSSADAVCQTSWLVSSAGQTAPAVDFYLKVALKRQGGTWKVDNVAGLAAVQPPGAGTPAPTTPPTTAPGSPPPTG
jgi:hypothetical protein